MSVNGLAVFDDTVHTTNVWLKELMDRLELEDRSDAYRALRETLHALRDRLPVNTAAALAAQFPMLIRGFYYEGWRPGASPNDDRTEDDFTDHLAKAFKLKLEGHDPGEIARAVFSLLNEKLSTGEIDKVKSCLPVKIKKMWPA